MVCFHRGGFRHLLGALVLFVLAFPFTASAEMTVFLAPDGGWADLNRNRTITTPDDRQLTPTIQNAVIDLIERTQPGGVIKMAMYAFNDDTILDLLIKCAYEKGIKVKLILDASADWTLAQRKALQERVEKARESAKEGSRWAFQLKAILPAAFRARGRTKRLGNDTIIGTMHEKFGVFYQPGMKVPFDCFSGSSNFCRGSDQVFGENRFVFRNDAAVARQYAEEFARLWNEYGTDVLGDAESEPYINADPAVGGVRVIFNGEPVEEEHNHRIDSEIEAALGRVHPKTGTIDIMMFSFTHFRLAERILEQAQRLPTIKVRILLDQTQIQADEERRGLMGPYLEEQIARRKLGNIEIRYKWRSNVFSWEDSTTGAGEKSPEGKETTAAVQEAAKVDPETDGVPGMATPTVTADPGKETTVPPAVAAASGSVAVPVKSAKIAPIHWRSLILHHKVLIVNRKVMMAGSYNWSSSAENRNLENLMVFDGKYPGQQEPIDRMLAEFDFLWDSLWQAGPYSARVTRPQVVTGPEGRELGKKIVQVLSEPEMRPIMGALDADRENKGLSAADLLAATKFAEADLLRALSRLVEVGLLFTTKDNARGQIWGLAD